VAVVKKIFVVFVCILLCFTFVWLFIRYNIGRQFVSAMYTYTPGEEESMNSTLRSYVSDEVYNRVTLANDQRQIKVYLRLKGEECMPHIISTQNGRVLFWLESKYIEPDRTFQVEYKQGFLKIVDLNESELFFLPPGGRDYYYD
jgi:hypothetical protein